MKRKKTVSRKEFEALREENRLLREKLDAVIRQLFGKKSERLDPAQLELLLSDVSEFTNESDEPGKPEASAPCSEAELAEALPPKPKKKPRPPRLPKHLPVEETVIEPEAVRAAPEAWRRIGEEVSEALDYRPGRFVRLRTIRPKYVSKVEADVSPVIAPLPPKLVEGGIVSPGLMTQIVIGKYCDHLPLYRQEQIFLQRHGVAIPRQTMARWVEAAAEWLQPIYEAIRAEVFVDGYLEVDETPIKYLQPGKGKTGQGYLWTYRRPGGDTVFDWRDGRGHECLVDLIPDDFSGVIQCDGYSAYRTFARAHRGGEVILAGCWAHVRRKFYEAFEAAEKGTSTRRIAGWILRQIQLMYRVERELRDTRAGPTLREARRASESRMILDRIHKALFRLKGRKTARILPKSQLGRAIDYALGQWTGLRVYLDDGRVEIDNNLVENAIRPTAIGKKNWLFIGDRDAGGRSAVLYTIIESCRGRGIDPYAYLKDMLTRLPESTNWQIAGMTPANWEVDKTSEREENQRAISIAS